jgi:hypothetical protein
VEVLVAHKLLDLGRLNVEVTVGLGVVVGRLATAAAGATA